MVRFTAVVAAWSTVLAGCSAGDAPSVDPGMTGGTGSAATGGAGSGANAGGAGKAQSGGAAGSGVMGGSGGAGAVGSGGAGGGVPLPPETTPAELLPAGIRRLTNEEFAGSVSALLGVTLPANITLPPDARQDGFTRNRAQRVDPVMAKQLDAIAQAVAEGARPKLETLAPCASSGGSVDCATSFIESFGEKAYRRPLTTEETTALLDLYRIGLDGGTYAEGIELVIRGILQSAGFLYITEIGDGAASDPIALTSRELATSLSYLVTAQPPTDAFIARAEAGEFSTPEGRAEGARDLLEAGDATPEPVLRMLKEWLGVDRIADVGKDQNVYRAWNDSVRMSMLGELRAFTDAVVKSGGGVSELLGADWDEAQPRHPESGRFSLRLRPRVGKRAGLSGRRHPRAPRLPPAGIAGHPQSRDPGSAAAGQDENHPGTFRDAQHGPVLRRLSRLDRCDRLLLRTLRRDGRVPRRRQRTRECRNDSHLGHGHGLFGHLPKQRRARARAFPESLGPRVLRSAPVPLLRGRERPRRAGQRG
jgi:hypothetical protein